MAGTTKRQQGNNNKKQARATVAVLHTYLSVDPQLGVELLYALVQYGVLLIGVGVTVKPVQSQSRPRATHKTQQFIIINVNLTSSSKITAHQQPTEKQEEKTAKPEIF